MLHFLSSLYISYSHNFSGGAPLRRIVNGCTLLALLFFVVSTPYFLVFPERSNDSLEAIETTSYALYIADIVIELTTSDDGVDHARSFHNFVRGLRVYLRGWCVVDVISALPYQTIMEVTTGSHRTPLLLLRVTKLSKFGRLARSVQGKAAD